MTSDLREEMRKATEETIVKLAHVRDCRRVDAAVAVAQSVAENLRDSRGTSMEDYWAKMSTVADSIVASETGARR